MTITLENSSSDHWACSLICSWTPYKVFTIAVIKIIKYSIVTEFLLISRMVACKYQRFCQNYPFYRLSAVCTYALLSLTWMNFSGEYIL